MTNNDRALLLLRVAQKCPEESVVLLQWAQELLEADGRRRSTSAVDRLPSVDRPSGTMVNGESFFPLPIVIRARGRRIDGVLYSDATVQVGPKRYRSVSGAASAELGYQEDGWRKWQYKRQDGGEGPIDELRQAGIVEAAPKQRRTRR